MDLSSFFYFFIVAFAVYFAAAVLGALIFPLFFAPERFRRFISGITDSEINVRDKLLFPLTKIFIRLNVHPNVITIIGVVLVAWLAAAFLRGASPAVILILTFFAGFSDMIDGPVARASNKITVTGGIMDHARDIMLILVVTAGIIMNNLLDFRLLIWFFGGETIIFLLKIWESTRHRLTRTIVDGFLWRATGEGKPVMDRIIFFFFVAAVIASISDAFFSANLSSVVFVLFLCSIFAIILSVVIHASLLRAVFVSKA